MNTTDKDKFLILYANKYGMLNPSQQEGFVALLTYIDADISIIDYRWKAYMLATVKHECAGTWQPIAEYWKGKGRKYGTPDPVTGQVYYGRGYVQLTWKANYQAMSKVTGADLVNHPELALTAPVAYRIMEYGMRNGSFTGVGLKKYIHEDVCDYLNARRIINGIDCAELIANYAKTIQGILEQSRVEKG